MNGKLKAIALLAVLYVLGVISGIAWQKYRIQQWRKIPDMYAQRRVEHLKKKLDLTPAQELTIKAIYQNAHGQTLNVREGVAWSMATIHRESVAAIRQVLTPEQLVKFEKVHQAYHDRHKNVPLDTETRPVPTAAAKP
jgi:hypothetical protein